MPWLLASSKGSKNCAKYLKSKKGLTFGQSLSFLHCALLFIDDLCQI